MAQLVQVEVIAVRAIDSSQAWVVVEFARGAFLLTCEVTGCSLLSDAR
jgi:hypothetical protein